MISVIIPVYNVEKYLSQCIESVLAQSYQDFEVILVDDGSPDKSGEICDNYVNKDNRIRVIHQSNSGVSAARNRGIEEAKGEWISFIDSDDFVDTDYLEKFGIENNQCDLIIQGLEYYDNRNGQYFKPVRYSDLMLTDDDFKKRVELNDLLRSGYPVAKLYKRSLLANELRFDETISFHEDHIFVLQAMQKAQTIRLVNSCSYKYRYYHSETSLSLKRHPWKMLNASADGMLRCLDGMKVRFMEEGSDYSKIIYHFAYSPKIDAVYELFRSVNSYKTRKEGYFEIINNKLLASNYHPVNAKNKIVKFVMLSMPYIAVDVFLRMVVKYQDRRH